MRKFTLNLIEVAFGIVDIVIVVFYGKGFGAESSNHSYMTQSFFHANIAHPNHPISRVLARRVGSDKDDHVI